MAKPVVLESPFAYSTILERRENELYAQRALADSLARDEAPFASHLLYPQVLDDLYPSQREQGIAGQLAWLDLARAVVVYVDRGITAGMAQAILHCFRHGYGITLRSLDPGITGAQVEALLEAQILIRDLFSDVVLQLPPLAGPHRGNGASAAQEAAGAPQDVSAPIPTPEPPASPPAPPAPAWGA